MKTQATIVRWTLAAAVLVASSSGQQVWKVHCLGGPGVHFTDLPPAVAAAAPGDTILVWDASASVCPNGYTAPTIDKPLRLVGLDPAATPSLGSTPTTAGMAGLLRITGIPAGQTCVISNMRIGVRPPVLVVPPQTTGFLIQDCLGEVLIENLESVGFGYGGPVFKIERCANVTLRAGSIYLEGSPIEVVDSNLLASFFSVWHDRVTWSPFTPSYSQGAPGMTLLRSTVTLASSLVNGMDVFSGSPAKHGVVLEQSTLRVGPGTLVRGGRVAGSPAAYAAPYSAANPTTSSVRLDPRGAFQPPLHPSGPAPIATAIDSTIHHYVVAGQNYNVGTCGPVNGHALLMLGDLAPAPVPTPYGPLAIDPPTAIFVRFSPLNGLDGCQMWSYPCPVTAPVGYAFAYQALTLSASGVFGLTLPSPVTVGWPHGQIP